VTGPEISADHCSFVQNRVDSGNIFQISGTLETELKLPSKYIERTCMRTPRIPTYFPGMSAQCQRGDCQAISPPLPPRSERP